MVFLTTYRVFISEAWPSPQVLLLDTLVDSFTKNDKNRERILKVLETWILEFTEDWKNYYLETRLEPMQSVDSVSFSCCEP